VGVSLTWNVISDPNRRPPKLVPLLDLKLSGDVQGFDIVDTRYSPPSERCSAATEAVTAPGPSVFRLEVSALLGLPGDKPRWGVYPGTPAEGTYSFSGSTCTLSPNSPPVTSPPISRPTQGPSAPGTVGCPQEPTPTQIVSSTASGRVVWGRRFTISVACDVTLTTSLPGGDVLHSHYETRLTIAMTPCPGRATSPCQ
jgi:hypothetical protein